MMGEMKNLINNAGGCVITKSLLNGETKLKWLFREEPSSKVDNGWVALGIDDTDEYINDSNNLVVVDFNTLANIEPAVLLVYNMPVGSELEFIEGKDESYFYDCNNKKEIHERVKSKLEIGFSNNIKFLSKGQYTTEDINKLFLESDKVKLFNIGITDIKSGKIVIADPLCYMLDNESTDILNYQIPKGSYNIEASIFYSKDAGLRIAAARMKITDKKAVSYKIVDTTNGKINGFGVETGLACFADYDVVCEYRSFIDDWYKKNPKGNHYDDYFASFFKESYNKYPTVQREDGDFIQWTNPKTGSKFVIFATGLGDGFYRGIWGFDESNEICELLIPFMDIDLFD